MKEKLLEIINNYGIVNQLRKFNEECFELEEAIIKLEMEFDAYSPKLGGEEHRNHITEEIADVCVMLHQFKEYYDIKPFEIYRVMEQKINRQISRMKEE